MRFSKILGAATAALVVIVCLLGAASASASTFCASNTNPCPESEIKYSGKAIEATLKSPSVLVKSSIQEFECTASKWKAVLKTDGSGELATGEVSEFEIASCKTLPAPGVACGAGTISGLPFGFGGAAGTGGNGTVVFATGAKGPPAAAFNCGKFVCTVRAGEIPMEFAGSLTAPTVKMKWTKMEFSGLSCPASAEVTAEYKVTSPAALFLESAVASPVLCKKNEAPCTPANTLGTGTALKAEFEAESKFAFTYGGVKKEPACKFSKLEGKTTAAGKPIVGEVTTLKFETCAGCTVEALHTPYKLEIDRTGEGNGNGWLRVSSNGSGPPTFLIQCTLTEKCTYETPSIEFGLTGAEAPAIPKLASSAVELTGSSALCSTSATWEGVGGVSEVKYKFLAPVSLFVRS